MRQNVDNFLYSNILGRTSQKNHPVEKMNTPVQGSSTSSSVCLPSPDHTADWKGGEPGYGAGEPGYRAEEPAIGPHNMAEWRPGSPPLHSAPGI